MIIAITGIAILVISVAGGLLLVGRDAPGRQRQTKILLFALYFWMLSFIQLIVVSIAYWMVTR